jgi:uncharacterized protein with PIN domain
MAPRTLLTAKQARFAFERAKPDVTAVQAALDAGYSPHTARDQAHRIAQLPAVAQAIRQHQQAYEDRRNMSVDDWHRELRFQYSRVREGESDDALRALDMYGKALGVYNRGDPDDAAKRSHELNLVLARLMGKQMDSQGKLPETVASPMRVPYRVLDERNQP